MTVDIPTTLAMLAMICATIGLIFAFVSLRMPVAGIPGRASAGLLMVAAGIALVLLRNRVPGWVAIDVANAILLTGIGLIWSTVRVFNGAPVPLPAIFAGAVFWLIACQIPAFRADVGYRIALFSVLTAAYTVAAGIDLRRNAGGSGVRRPLAILAFVHGAVVLFRGGYGLVAPPPATIFDGDWVWGLLTAEAAIAVVGGALLSVGLVRERIEQELRRRAETDPLTGVLNRRAFFADGAAIIANATKGGRSIALLLFDLDHFKAINDVHGHLVGDATLQMFTGIVTRSVRSGDLIGRVGGEEFAVLLDNASLQVAEAIGERIRAGLSATNVMSASGGVDATVSVGIAVGSDLVLEALFAKADQALYAAKRGGRDQVRVALALAS